MPPLDNARRTNVLRDRRVQSVCADHDVRFDAMPCATCNSRDPAHAPTMVDDHAVHTNVIVDLCPAVDGGID